jgi:Pentapeptide repeats (8 copies)
MRYALLHRFWRPLRRPVTWAILRIAGYCVGAALVIGFTLLAALDAPLERALWVWLKALFLPAVIALLGIFGGAWFTRERARDTALQAYLAEMSELLIGKEILQERGRYAATRVTARARTLAVLSQLDGKRKRTVLLFLREARLINKRWRVREGRQIYPGIVGLRNADLSNARLRSVQLISTDRKEPVSLQGAILRRADLRCADLEGADLRGADMRSADMRGACLRGVDLDDSGETNRPADLRGADLRETEGLDEELLRNAVGDQTTKLSGKLNVFNEWHTPVNEHPCREEPVPRSPRT